MINLKLNEIDFKILIKELYEINLKRTKIKEVKKIIKNYYKEIIIEKIREEEYLNKNFVFNKAKLSLEPIKISKELIEKHKEELKKILSKENYLENEEKYYEKNKEEIIESKIKREIYGENYIKIGEKRIDNLNINEEKIKYKKEHEIYFEMITKKDIEESTTVIKEIEDLFKINFMKILKEKNNNIENKIDFLIFFNFFEEGDTILIKQKGKHYISYNFKKNEIEYTKIVFGLGEEINIKKEIKNFKNYEEFENCEKELENANKLLFKNFKKECEIIKPLYELNKFKNDINYICKILNIN